MFHVKFESKPLAMLGSRNRIILKCQLLSPVVIIQKDS